MKKRYIFGFLLVAAFLFVCGCAGRTPIETEEAAEEFPPFQQSDFVYIEGPGPVETLMPLTISILQRLFDTNDQMFDDIHKYQLILFGRIFLERNYTQSNSSLSAGRVTFEEHHFRDEITILDQTEGVVLEVEIVNDEIILSVSFEKEPKFDDCLLKFSTMQWDTDGYFYLVYMSNGRTSALGEEKGIIQYGGPDYKLKFSGEKPPYLLIQLTQRDIDRVNTRTASGRRVGN